jgi:adenylate cyclase
MRQLCYCIIFFFSTQLAVGENANLDSLFSVWNNTGKADTSRLRAMEDIIWKGYITTKPDSALFYSKAQYDFAEKKGLKKQMAEALNNQGVCFFYLGKYDEAMTFYEKGVELCLNYNIKTTHPALLNNIGRIYRNRGETEKAKANYSKALALFKELEQSPDKKEANAGKKGIANTLNNIASIFQERGENDSAIAYYSQSLVIKEELNDKKGIAGALNNIGIIYFYKGNYAQAIDYWTKSLRIKEELGDKRSTAPTLHNIGNIYIEQKDYEKAFEYYSKSLAIREEIGDKDGIAHSLNVIGTLYAEKNDYEKAIDFYTKALKIRQEMGKSQEAASVLNNLGTAWLESGDLEKALDCFTQSFQILEKSGDKKSLSTVLNGMGTIYFKKGNISKAIEYSEKSLQLAREAEVIKEIKSAAGSLHTYYKTTGNYKKALEMNELFMLMRDSMMSEENQKEVMRQQFQYDYDKKESQAKAEQEKKDAIAAAELRRKNQQRNASIAGFSVMLLFAVVFFMQRNKISKAKKRSEELLLNILPEEVAEELKEKGSAEAKLIDEVTVLFTDFKGFTSMSEKLSAQELVKDLNECFSAFDRIMEKYGMEKIKTIGDSYMAAGGLPTPNTTHAGDAIKAAIEMRDFISQGKASKTAAGLPYFEIRIGIHTGPVVAGIVGVKKFQYDIWGDTVNTASRMESSGEVGKINISETTYRLVKDNFNCEYRGEIEAKGKGKVKMYFVGA